MQVLNGQKYIWNLPSVDTNAMLDIASTYNISFAIAQTLISRGFTTKEAIDAYLFSSFERDVADALLLKDCLKAVERIEYAIAHKEKILVFGDYDVDGIISSSLMMINLLPVGAQVHFFLPHRVKDGYGLSTAVVERAARNGYKLIITVDNGITAYEPAQRAKQLGIDLIITDHHQPHDQVPDAYAIVNPHQQDCPYPYKKFAGVGVIFKVLTLLYQRCGKSLPTKAYELLLLGTIADVVPLTGENRFWVRHGLTYIHGHESFSLQQLKLNGKVTKAQMSSLDIGFNITPQINALGRLEDPRQGVKFLIGSEQHETEQVGKILLELNEARKGIERSVLQEIEAEIKSGRIDLSKENIILAASSSWPPGVIGLVASRLVGAYGRPALLFHLGKNGISKGSCRSIGAFNMFHALQSASHLLEKFGGHAQAAGLSLKTENLPALKDHLEQRIAAQLTPFDLAPKITLDASLLLPDVNSKFIADMQHLEPFGNENPQPLFYVPGVTMLQKPTLLKDLHVKCQIFCQGVIKPVIFFNRPELYEQFIAQADTPFDCAVHVIQNFWNDKVSIELQGIDVALGNQSEQKI